MSIVQKILVGCCVLFGLLWLAALAGLFLSSEDLKLDALAEGRSARILLSTGEIEGNVGRTLEETLRISGGEAEAPSDKTKKPAEDASAEEGAVDTHHGSEWLKGLNLNLVEVVEGLGALPIIGADGVVPWRYYANQTLMPADKPAIAVVIDRLGLSELASSRAVALPAEIGLGFSPYTKDLDGWVERSRNKGHEVWLDMPIESADYPASDPGPLGLMKELTPAENYTRLQKLLARTGAYVGMMVPEDEAFAADKAMNYAYVRVSTRGVLSLFQGKRFRPLNNANMALYVDRRLVSGGTVEEWNQTLSELESMAKTYGAVILVVEPVPAAIELVGKWSKTLSHKNIALVPVTAIAKVKEAEAQAAAAAKQAEGAGEKAAPASAH